MRSFWTKLSLSAVVLAMLLTAVPPADAQGVTTGTLFGTVTAIEDGSRLPGVIVTAAHVPTGTRYTSITGKDGRYNIQNVRVGPYTVTYSLEGFTTREVTDVVVELGEGTELEAALELEAIEETVTVTSDADPLINPSTMGIATNVSTEAIEDLPTVNRSLQELVRTSPYFSQVIDDGEGTAISVAGRNNRYNNIQIDGAVNNDLFGLADSGTPGGQAETQPIALDAIEELQLVVSPYDVRQGVFSGGGINAITRSGTNRLEGSVYYFTRDQDLVGDGPDDQEFGEFDEDQYGFRLGGPIIQDELFFFTSAEVFERSAPSGFSADGSGGQAFINPTEAAEFRQIATDVYGYDPGPLSQFTEERNNDKIFARLDWNATAGTQLTLRHNSVDADNDRYFPSTFSYDFPDRNYDFLSETNSTVFQANSTLGAGMFNELRITYQTIRDNRGGGEPFPAITVELEGGGEVEAGVEPFSTKNSLDQDIVELNDDFTLLTGDHTITVGTHNEWFQFDNLFIRQAFGDYEFPSLADFEAGRARSFDYSFSNTDDPNQSAELEVYQVGAYAGDQWRVTEDVTLTYGLRFDVPLFPDAPGRNRAAEQFFGFRTDEVPDGNFIWSPRIGFNWDLTGEGKQQLRGGTGIFAGRTPYVWISNQFSNTGLEFTRISAFIPDDEFDPQTNFIPFEPDPFDQPTDLPGIRTATNEINVIDPDFEFPQVWRTTLGYDVNLPWWGLTATVEGMYSDTRKDVAFKNLNVVPTGETLALDGRPLFETKNGEFRDVILLTNTDEGEQWNVAFKLDKPFRRGFFGSLSYLYGESRVVNDGTSSQARSNWRFMEVQGDPNEPALGYSDFDVRHRINAMLSYNFDIPLGGLSSTVSLFYNAQSGQPYSTTFRNDVNGDIEDNDLIYVPASADEVVVVDGTWEQLNAYIESDEGLRDARGEIVERNASRAPWIHLLDFHFDVELPIQRYRPQLTFDVLNVANLIDSDAGTVEYVPFGEISPVSYRGIDEATGKPIYELEFAARNPDERFTVNDLRSRWQAKVGLRFSF